MAKPYFMLPVLMLLAAMLPGLPYGYFTLLRLVVTFCAVFIAVGAWQSHASISSAIFAMIGILFNPVILVGLPRAIWWWVDGATAAVFIGAFAMYEWIERSGSPTLGQSKSPRLPAGKRP